MKIEPNKFYKTRNGHKARIYTTDGYGDYPIHGAVLMDNGWRLVMWTSDGCNYINSSLKATTDIISEWQDIPIVNWAAMPAWCNYVAMDADGVWGIYTDKPITIDCYWSSKNRWSIPEEYYPIFTGNWKDSLAKRP